MEEGTYQRPSAHELQATIPAIFGPRYSPQQNFTAVLLVRFLTRPYRSGWGGGGGKSTDLPWKTLLLVIPRPQKVRNEVVLDAISNPDYSLLLDCRPALDY